MSCDPPKSKLILFGESLVLQYRIASIPIVLLIMLSIIQISIVLILIPALVSIFTIDYCNTRLFYCFRLLKYVTSLLINILTNIIVGEGIDYTIKNNENIYYHQPIIILMMTL